MKASTKLFLFNRLKSKKLKNSQSPPKCPKEGSSDGSVFESELTPFAQVLLQGKAAVFKDII